MRHDKFDYNQEDEDFTNFRSSRSSLID